VLLPGPSTKLIAVAGKKDGGLYFLQRNPTAELKLGSLLVAGNIVSEATS